MKFFLIVEPYLLRYLLNEIRVTMHHYTYLVFIWMSIRAHAVFSAKHNVDIYVDIMP